MTAADKDDNIVGDVVLVLVLVVVVVMGIYTEDDNREGDSRDDLQRRWGVELPVYRRDDAKAVGAGAVWVDSAVSVVAVAVAVEKLSWYARFLDDRDDEYNYCHPLLLCSYYSYGCYSRYYYNY